MISRTWLQPESHAVHRGDNRLFVVDRDGMVYAKFGTLDRAERAVRQLIETGKLNHSELET